jgi:hypothetical protein
MRLDASGNDKWSNVGWSDVGGKWRLKRYLGEPGYSTTTKG